MSIHLAEYAAPDGDTSISRLEPLLYRVTEAAEALRLSRSVIFDLIRTGRLRSVKEGRVRLVPKRAIHEYIELLERESEAA